MGKGNGLFMFRSAHEEQAIFAHTRSAAGRIGDDRIHIFGKGLKIVESQCPGLIGFAGV